MVGSIDPRCETVRGTHWPKPARVVDWSSRRGNHLGQRFKLTASTGRTYGCKRSDLTKKASCATGAVHIWVPARTRSGQRKCAVGSSLGRDDDEVRPTACAAKGFKHHENLFSETLTIASRNSSQRRRPLITQTSGVVVALSSPADVCRFLKSSGDFQCPSELLCCPPSLSARWR
jgi:hypothetical protein